MKSNGEPLCTGFSIAFFDSDLLDAIHERDIGLGQG